MLFSVIIPVFNVQGYLKQCLESVIFQAENLSRGCEIILVDDGSTDSSGIICDEYLSKYPNLIKVIHKNNQGLLLARRSGLAVASGEYIINLDSDDMLTDNALSCIEKCVLESNIDIIFFNIDLLKDEGRVPYFKDVFTREKECSVEKIDVIKSYFTDTVPAVTSMAAKAVKRNCYNLKKDYSKFRKFSMGEDTLQSAEVFENAHNFVYINEAFYVYRLGSGMTSSFKENYYETFSAIIKYIDCYSYLHDNEEYPKWKNIKLLNTFGRAITQLSTAKKINYSYVNTYICNLLRNRELVQALSQKKHLKKYLSKKYYLIIFLAENGLMFLIYIILRIKAIKSIK